MTAQDFLAAKSAYLAACDDAGARAGSGPIHPEDEIAMLRAADAERDVLRTIAATPASSPAEIAARISILTSLIGEHDGDGIHEDIWPALSARIAADIAPDSGASDGWSTLLPETVAHLHAIAAAKPPNRIVGEGMRDCRLIILIPPTGNREPQVLGPLEFQVPAYLSDAEANDFVLARLGEKGWIKCARLELASECGGNIIGRAPAILTLSGLLEVSGDDAS